MMDISILVNHLLVFVLIFSFFIFLIRIPFYFIMKIEKLDNKIIYHTPTFLAFLITITLITQKIIIINIY